MGLAVIRHREGGFGSLLCSKDLGDSKRNYKLFYRAFVAACRLGGVGASPLAWPSWCFLGLLAPFVALRRPSAAVSSSLGVGASWRHSDRADARSGALDAFPDTLEGAETPLKADLRYRRAPRQSLSDCSSPRQPLPTLRAHVTRSEPNGSDRRHTLRGSSSTSDW